MNNKYILYKNAYIYVYKTYKKKHMNVWANILQSNQRVGIMQNKTVVVLIRFIYYQLQYKVIIW